MGDACFSLSSRRFADWKILYVNEFSERHRTGTAVRHTDSSFWGLSTGSVQVIAHVKHFLDEKRSFDAIPTTTDVRPSPR